MYFSRRFPASLVAACEEPDAAADAALGIPASAGVLVPFLDLLNHAPGARVTWTPATEATRAIEFSSDGGVAPGAEINNNYGAKSNEELLMVHGFALDGNVHDTCEGAPRAGRARAVAVAEDETLETKTRPGRVLAFPLPLTRRYGLQLLVASGSGSREKALGPFYIHRPDSPSDPQFPAALWRALGGGAPSPSSARASARADDDDDGYSGAELEVDFEAAEALLNALVLRCASFEATAGRDRARASANAHGALAARAVAVARYRDGQVRKKRERERASTAARARFLRS